MGVYSDPITENIRPAEWQKWTPTKAQKNYEKTRNL